MTNFTVIEVIKERDFSTQNGPFKSYTLELENHPEPVELVQKPETPAPTSGQVIDGNIEPPRDPQYPAKLKKTQQPRPGGGGRSPQETASIVRQHSQEMALRWFAIQGELPATPAGNTDLGAFRQMVDWFQADAGGASQPPSTQAHASAPQSASNGQGGGFASERQRAFMERLLKDAGASSNEAASVTAFCNATMEGGRGKGISDAIDLLKDKGTSGAAVVDLMQKAEVWEQSQPDPGMVPDEVGL